MYPNELFFFLYNDCTLFLISCAKNGLVANMENESMTKTSMMTFFHTSFFIRSLWNKESWSNEDDDDCQFFFRSLLLFSYTSNHTLEKRITILDQGRNEEIRKYLHESKVSIFSFLFFFFAITRRR